MWYKWKKWIRNERKLNDYNRNCIRLVIELEKFNYVSKN